MDKNVTSEPKDEGNVVDDEMVVLVAISEAEHNVQQCHLSESVEDFKLLHQRVYEGLAEDQVDGK